MFDYFTLNNLIQFIKLICNITVVWVAFYFILKIVKNNARTIQIFKGIILIFIIKALADVLGLKAIEYLADLFVQYGPIAIIIIFQPEIRALLEKIGKTNIFSSISTLTLNERERLVDELVKACGEMSKTKTGALISLEQGHSLSDFIKTGTPMNSVVTSELLCSIFVPGTPLHDGAVILQGVKIACAAAYFPPTTQDLPTMYGARHRAAVGISEITDSITIIVSEETGNISIAEGGKLNVVTEKSLREFLTMVICQTQNEVQGEKISKTSDSEKDIEPGNDVGKEVDDKQNRVSSIFHSKNKTEKKKGVKKRFTKAKDAESDAHPTANAEKIGIANLVEESMPLDHLFDSIVSDTESKGRSAPAQKKSAAKPKQEMPSQRKSLRKSADEGEKKSDAVDAMMNPTVKLEEPQPAPVKKKKKALLKKSEIIPTTGETQNQNTASSPEADLKPMVKPTTTAVAVKPVVKRSHAKQQKDAAALLDDVISPEAIVLNYKEDKQTKSQSRRKKSSRSTHEGGER